MCARSRENSACASCSKEASARPANRIRITAQLIDATTGVHIWADRFDRDLDDIFAVQDEITLTLATEMQVRLTEGEQARLRYTTTTNVEAWNLWIQGLNYDRRPKTPELHLQARRCWEKALALDPGSAVLNAMLGDMHYLRCAPRLDRRRPRDGVEEGGSLCRAGAVRSIPKLPTPIAPQRHPAAEVAIRRGGGCCAQGGEARPQPA